MAGDDREQARKLIDAAAERGLVTAAQRDAMQALERELEETRAAGTEVPRGLNSVTVAYAIGALLVVFAFAWFLADRWQSLGPWGVLAVAAVYAGLLLACNRWLETRGYSQAASIALVLAVMLTPAVVWSLQVISGAWPPDRQSDWLDDADRWMSALWAVVDLATIGAALVAFRWRPSVALTIPMTVMLWALWLHCSRVFAGEHLTGSLDRWLFLANGLFVCAVAGEVDRWQVRARAAGESRGGDFAFFPWLGGLLAFTVGYMSVWGSAGAWRHLLVAVALALVALSLFLRRRTHLVFGLLGLFGYLAFISLDVFRDYLSLPAVLATLGILLILATVWVQRRFPRLVERVNAGREGTTLPAVVRWGPFVLVFGIALLSIVSIEEEVALLAYRQRLALLQLHSGSVKVTRSTIPRRVPHSRSTTRGTDRA